MHIIFLFCFIFFSVLPVSAFFLLFLRLFVFGYCTLDTFIWWTFAVVNSNPLLFEGGAKSFHEMLVSPIEDTIERTTFVSERVWEPFSWEGLYQPFVGGRSSCPWCDATTLMMTKHVVDTVAEYKKAIEWWQLVAQRTLPSTTIDVVWRRQKQLQIGSWRSFRIL